MQLALLCAMSGTSCCARIKAVLLTTLPTDALLNTNRELITRFEAKIAATLARVWGDVPQ